MVLSYQVTVLFKYRQTNILNILNKELNLALSTFLLIQSKENRDMGEGGLASRLQKPNSIGAGAIELSVEKPFSINVVFQNYIGTKSHF
jgi:hypothetical protein